MLRRRGRRSGKRRREDEHDFYFTAMGNCRYVADQLAEKLGDEVRSIPQEMRRAGELSYAGETIGIVYPIYGHMMPHMVREFVERAKFDTPYFFLVLTYGCRHANAVEIAQEQMRAVSIEPAYISTLLMVDNWLPNFDMNEQRAMEPGKRIGENLARIGDDVAGRRCWIEPVSDVDREAHAQFMSRGIGFEPADLGNFLCIDPQACTGCGICARVCPAGCIHVEEGAAVRDALAGQGCNACLACIHACANGAISLPMGEANPQARFRNSHVTLAQIMQANETDE